MVFDVTKKNAINSEERDKKFPEEQLNASFPTKFVWIYTSHRNLKEILYDLILYSKGVYKKFFYRIKIS